MRLCLTLLLEQTSLTTSSKMIHIKKELKEELRGKRFIDLFCGIGGFHLALSSFGAKCVFASDINNEARKVYYNNFGIFPQGDIRKISNESIPSHDILCGGFPCQSFSISGSQSGFNDPKNGKLFYEIIRIAAWHQPKIIILENVANLEKHDKGKSINVISTELNKIGYNTFYHVLNALDFNIPQYRNRLYIIAFRTDLGITDFKFPAPTKTKMRLQDILLDEKEISENYYVNRSFSLRERYEQIIFSRKNPYIRIGEIGQGRQGERVYSIKGCATTLSASGGGLGGRTGLYLINNRIRKLVPTECARLMGFPKKFIIAESTNQAYQQFGNSVVVNVLQHVVIKAIQTIKENKHGQSKH